MSPVNDVRVISGSEQRVIQHTMSIMSRLDGKIENPAIAFDVDDTLIRWNPSDGVSVAPHPIVHRLYEHARKLGYQIFIITARSHSNHGLEYMVDQLHGAGYHLRGTVPHGGMYMTPLSYQGNEHPGEFKSDARTDIEKKFGVNMVVMVGDKFWDMIRSGRPPVALDNTEYAHLLVKPDTNTMLGLKLRSVDGDDG